MVFKLKPILIFLTNYLELHIRLTAHFLVQIRQGELRSQWTWEPLMSESLILSLLDPNDVICQIYVELVEHVYYPCWNVMNFVLILFLICFSHAGC